MIFNSIEDFYGKDERRRTSPEADYGVHWRQSGFRGRFRISYVKDTEEIYAVQDGEKLVIVLGKFPADQADLYYGTLDRALEDWAEQCPQNQDGLSWVIQRLERNGGESIRQRI